MSHQENLKELLSLPEHRLTIVVPWTAEVAQRYARVHRMVQIALEDLGEVPAHWLLELSEAEALVAQEALNRYGRDRSKP